MTSSILSFVLCTFILVAAVTLTAFAQADGGSSDDFGNYGIPGCPYFTPYQHGPSTGFSPYDASSASDKLLYVFSQLVANQTSANLVPLSQGLIFTESMLPTVTFQSDFTPLGRQKAVHGDGVVCGVRLEIDEDARSKLSYTGLLWHGSDTAVLRLSSVLDPSVVGGPVPSIAVKFFKDAALSANVVALNSEAPQLTTTNAFAYPLATQFVALPQAILTKFETVTSYPNFTGTSQLAYVRHPDEQQLNFPWQLVFVPNPVVQRALPEHYAYSSSAGYYEQFLPPAVDITGLVMYFVYAVDLPGEEAAYLGALRATTPFYRSDFGDRTLFFKHTRTEEDIQFRPEFGVLCPVEGPTCSPCPQTYDCISDHWRTNIDYDGPYASYYADPAVRKDFQEVSPAMAKAWGTPAHPGSDWTV